MVAAAMAPRAAPSGDAKGPDMSAKGKKPQVRGMLNVAPPPKQQQQQQQEEHRFTSGRPKMGSAIQFSFKDIFSAPKVKAGKQLKVTIGGGLVNTIARAEKKKIPVRTRQAALANVLDSSAPSKRRGKERERAARKRPSALKKALMIEKEAKRRLRALIAGPTGKATVGKAKTGEDEDGYETIHEEEVTASEGAVQDQDTTGTAQQAVVAAAAAAAAPKTEDPKGKGAAKHNDGGSDEEEEDGEGEDGSSSEEEGASTAKQPLAKVSAVTAAPTAGAGEAKDNKAAEKGESKKSKVRKPQLTEKSLEEGVAAMTMKSFFEVPEGMGHSRKYREYCRQLLDDGLDEMVTTLLQELKRFQDRAKQTDPIKAKTKKRFVMGLREVTKLTKLGKMQVIVVAPDLQKSQAEGGIDDVLSQIFAEATERKIPVVCALTRKRLGRTLNKPVGLGVVGIVSVDGANELAKDVIAKTEELARAYEEKLAQSKLSKK